MSTDDISWRVEDEAKWKIGALVQKTEGGSWNGIVVGYYSTAVTPIGYCVESFYQPGSVRVWPEAELTDWGGDPAFKGVRS